jgi:hypothetical protein
MLWTQILWMFVLAIPVASISWTVIKEEVFREPREYCIKRSQKSKRFPTRKFFYLFTCEYCFSHYITILIIFISGFKMLFDDWRGYLIAGFSVVWVANVYMSLYAHIRMEIKEETFASKLEEKELEQNNSTHE